MRCECTRARLEMITKIVLICVYNQLSNTAAAEENYVAVSVTRRVWVTSLASSSSKPTEIVPAAGDAECDVQGTAVKCPGSRLCLCSVTDNGAYNLDAIELKVGGLPHRDWDQLLAVSLPSTWLLIHKSACSCANGQDPCACEARVLRNEIGPVLCCGRQVPQTVSRMTAAPACRPKLMKIIVPPERDLYQEPCLAGWSIY